jgi:hypothetical protein
MSERIAGSISRLQRQIRRSASCAVRFFSNSFWLVSLGAEGAQGRQLTGRHRGVDLIGDVTWELQRCSKDFWAGCKSNLKFVLILFSLGEVNLMRPPNEQQA